MDYHIAHRKVHAQYNKIKLITKKLKETSIQSTPTPPPPSPSPKIGVMNPHQNMLGTVNSGTSIASNSGKQS